MPTASCGSYRAFTQVGSNDPSSPFTDNAAGGITRAVLPVRVRRLGQRRKHHNVRQPGRQGRHEWPVGAVGELVVRRAVTRTSAADRLHQRAGRQVGQLPGRRHLNRQRLRHPQAQLPHPQRLHKRRRRHQQQPLPDHLQLDRRRRRQRQPNNHRHNNATLTNTNTFTITPDTTNPNGGALTINSTTATGAGSTSYNSSGSFTIGAITDYSDAGSGLDSSTADPPVSDAQLL